MKISEFIKARLGRLQQVWRSGWPGRTLLVSALLLLPGLLLPVLTVDTLGSPPASYSILQGVWALLVGGRPGLGLLIFSFSVLFPVIKLVVLLRFCLQPERGPRGPWLLLLGKWSMLDVFVVAVIVGAGRLRLLSSFEAAHGVYWFAGAIALTLLGAEMLLKLPQKTVAAARPAFRDRVTGLLPLTGLALLLAGLTLPLMQVNKWLFWRNPYSLASALPKMLEEGEWLLPLILLVTVLLAPALRLGASLGYRVSGKQPFRTVQTLSSQWSMLSVFVLALLLVMLKLGDAAVVEPRAGLWVLTAAAVVTSLDGWLLRRRNVGPVER